MARYPFHNGPFHNMKLEVQGEPERVYFLFSQTPVQKDADEIPAFFHEYLRQSFRGTGAINTGYTYGGIVGPMMVYQDLEVPENSPANNWEENDESSDMQLPLLLHTELGERHADIDISTSPSDMIAPRRPRGRPRNPRKGTGVATAS